MSVSNGQLANAATFNGAFVSKTADSTTSGVLTQDKESVIKEIATPATPSSGYGKIYFKADGKLYQLNDAGIETQVGSGAGGAGVANFISNGSAEDNNTTGWGTYADAAGTSPVDGSGGTANVTISTSASSPLIGTYSFLMVKDAVNRQGEGWEYDFTIDSAYKAKVLQIDFEYLVSSGTFAAGTSSTDSDVTVWIYDVTNAVVIQPSAYKLLSNSSTLSTKHSATFQSASNSTSYRLIFHVGSTSASAYTLKVDGISVSPEQYVYGTPVTDWQAYTPTLTGFGTPTNVQFQWRRVGDNVEVRGKFTSGTSTATEARATLPSVTSADTGKIPSIQLVGMAALSPTAANSRTVLIEPSVGYVTFGITTAGPLTKANATLILSSGETMSFFALVPVQGFSSSVQTSDQTDTRVVAASYQRSTSQSITVATDTVVVYDTKRIDTHAAMNTSNGRFYAPVSGFYRISASVFYNSFTPAAGNPLQLRFRKRDIAGSVIEDLYKDNFTANAAVGQEIALRSASQFFCNAGEQLEVVLWQNTSATRTTIANINFVEIERLSGPSAIAASESISAIYQTSAGQSIPHNTATVIVFGTKVHDSHSAMNASTGVFTCPISGEYQISGGIYFSTAITATATDIQFIATKNGSYYLGVNHTKSGTANAPLTTSGTIRVRCNAGDTLSVSVLQANSASSAQTLLTNATFNWVSISRVGN
jgi:hypothetical protein